MSVAYKMLCFSFSILFFFGGGGYGIEIYKYTAAHGMKPNTCMGQWAAQVFYFVATHSRSHIQQPTDTHIHQVIQPTVHSYIHRGSQVTV